MFQDIRDACARVASRANFVDIKHDFISDYALSLLLPELETPVYDSVHHYEGKAEVKLAYLITLAAINFGSGYFPYLEKRPKMAGYFTVASCLKDVFEAKGSLSAEYLLNISVADCQRIFKQSSGQPLRDELMGLFARALNDLGSFLLEGYQGSFAALVEDARQSAERLASLLSAMPFFQDCSLYQGFNVPFYKRAQITASDLALAFDNKGFGRFHDLDKLTIFADNLVPHVLRVDGLLNYSAELAEKLEAGEWLKAGSPEEIEIRAVAVHATELLAQVFAADHKPIAPRHLDIVLWNRGQAEAYRKLRRHRTLSVFY